jgi:hypothetical protein
VRAGASRVCGKHAPITETIFTYKGKPSTNDFCISAYNAGGTANTATTKEYMFDSAGGGLRTGATAIGAGCP